MIRSVRAEIGRRRRSRVGWLAATGLALLCGALVVPALSERSSAAGDVDVAPAAPTGNGPSFAVRARAVYPVTPGQPGPIAGGIVVVRDGKIAAVGADVEIPRDLRLIEMPDAVICPGLVSAASNVVGPHPGDESVSGAYHAIDAYDNYDGHRMHLAHGTTTAHLSPGGHRLVSGVGAVVKLAGPPDERTLIELADLNVNLGVFNPPPLVKRPFYASADVAIEPAERQRPDSRLGQLLELDERVSWVRQWLEDPAAMADAEFDLHRDAFAEAWAAKLPVRVNVLDAADIEAALTLPNRLGISPDRLYLVGLAEGDDVAERLASSGLRTVIQVDRHYRHPGGDVGLDPDAIEDDLSVAGKLVAKAPHVPRAIAPTHHAHDLRMAAILAVRGGMPRWAALAAITAWPAEILGVDSRVGSLAPGKDADLVVLTDDPLALSSHVRQVYVGGRVVYEAPMSDALVVRGERIWVGDGSIVEHGAILIEDGKIQAVGERVPHPPLARVIDAGPGSFLTPGFIDAHGHLGLQGDRSSAGAELPLERLLAVADAAFHRVARAGVTTVMMTPYRGPDNGTRIAAIKTYGHDRDALVARAIGAMKFTFLERDPALATKSLRGALQSGKQYVEQWKQYEKELAEWKKGGDDDKKSEEEQKDDKAEEQPKKEEKVDPITGRWEGKLSGDPLPEEVEFPMTLKLTGNSIEGRVQDPAGSGEEAILTGKLEGDQVTLEIDQETPMGKPKIVATLDREDHMEGELQIAQFAIHFEADRTDKGPVEFKVKRRKGKRDDGRPEPPPVRPELEPYRPLFGGEVPAVVRVQTAAQIDAVIELFVKEFELPVVLLGAEEAPRVLDTLAAHADKLGVIVPPELETRWERKPYHPVVDLSRQGVPVALQSDGEDAARDLPLMGLFAVQQGLGGDAALRALTSDAARMYKLDEHVGTLQAGRDGDVLIFDGHPFDVGTQLRRVIVRGQEVPDDE